RMKYAGIAHTNSMPRASLRIRFRRLRCAGGAEDVAPSEDGVRPTSSGSGLFPSGMNGTDSLDTRSPLHCGQIVEAYRPAGRGPTWSRAVPFPLSQDPWMPNLDAARVTHREKSSR